MKKAAYQENDFRIRKASLSDAFDISQIHSDVWQKTFESMFHHSYNEDSSISRMVSFKEKNILNEQEIHLVSLYKDKIVGFCEAGPINRKGKSRFPDGEEWNYYINCGEIYSIYVLNEYQNLGLGQSLFKEAKNLLQKQNLSPILVWTLKANVQACRFYEKLGGRIVVEKGCIQLKDKSFEGIAYLI